MKPQKNYSKCECEFMLLLTDSLGLVTLQANQSEATTAETDLIEPTRTVGQEDTPSTLISHNIIYPKIYKRFLRNCLLQQNYFRSTNKVSHGRQTLQYSSLINDFY